jgi:hypothetical protein
MTKEMAQAMLVAQRYTERRIAAGRAKKNANDLLHVGLQLSDNGMKLICEFMHMCDRIHESHDHHTAKKYVEGLTNG